MSTNVCYLHLWMVIYAQQLYLSISETPEHLFSLNTSLQKQFGLLNVVFAELRIYLCLRLILWALQGPWLCITVWSASLSQTCAAIAKGNHVTLNKDKPGNQNLFFLQEQPQNTSALTEYVWNQISEPQMWYRHHMQPFNTSMLKNKCAQLVWALPIYASHLNIYLFTLTKTWRYSVIPDANIY